MDSRVRHRTVGVAVGPVQVGGGAPVVVQSMANTDTADVASTARQCIELAQAGSEMVRVTVNVPEAAQAVPEIKRRMLDAGVAAPLIGDFHYNGHVLLTKYPEMAEALDKYRINPGNVGKGARRDEQFATICGVARDRGKPVRIGVNGGSLNQELVMAKMQENTDGDLGRTSEEIINECMVLSALQSTELALQSGLRKDQIIISCKVSRPLDLIAVYRDLAKKTDQPLHLGLTEAGMGAKGLVWSASAMGVLLNEGIGDTIRVSLTPRPGGDRREEVYAACELLQSLGIRSFAPSVTACPGCGRTTSTTFQELAERIQGYVRDKMPEWKTQYEGVENMTLAVMGCVVNGPGRVQGRLDRHLAARHGRGAALPRVHRRTALHDAQGQLRGAFRRLPRARRRLRRDPVPPTRGQGPADRLTARNRSRSPRSRGARALLYPVTIAPGWAPCARASARSPSTAAPSGARRTSESAAAPRAGRCAPRRPARARRARPRDPRAPSAERRGRGEGRRSAATCSRISSSSGARFRRAAGGDERRRRAAPSGRTARGRFSRRPRSSVATASAAWPA